jgi:hypothetical protein
MFSCFGSSRVVDESVEFERKLYSMNHYELRELCLKLKEEHKEEMQRLKDNEKWKMRTVHNMYSQLEKRINSEIASIEAERKAFQAEKARLLKELENATKREEGLQASFSRQVREVKALREELDAVLSDLMPVRWIFTSLQSMVDEMGEILTDPVSYVILHDPVVLPTGHAYNKDTINRMQEGVVEGGTFRCPKSQVPVLSNGTGYNKVVTIADLSELYLRMNKWLETNARKAAVIREEDAQ